MKGFGVRVPGRALVNYLHMSLFRLSAKPTEGLCRGTGQRIGQLVMVPRSPAVPVPRAGRPACAPAPDHALVRARASVWPEAAHPLMLAAHQPRRGLGPALALGFRARADDLPFGGVGRARRRRVTATSAMRSERRPSAKRARRSADGCFPERRSAPADESRHSRTILLASSRPREGNSAARGVGRLLLRFL